MKPMLFACAALMLALRPAAHAADLASIDCVAKTIGPAAVTRIVTAKADSFKTPLDEAMGKDFQGFRDALARCRASNKWSDKAAALAENVFRSTINRDANTIGLRKLGFDPQAVIASYRTMDESLRRSISRGEFPSAMMSVIADELTRQGADDNTDREVAMRSGVLFVSLALLEFTPEVFAEA